MGSDSCTRFFTIVSDPKLNFMTIPNSVSRRLTTLGHRAVNVTTTDGRSWLMSLDIGPKGLCLNEGYSAFRDWYNIKIDQVILFTFDADMKFYASIFDWSSRCEVLGPQNEDESECSTHSLVTLPIPASQLRGITNDALNTAPSKRRKTANGGKPVYQLILHPGTGTESETNNNPDVRARLVSGVHDPAAARCIFIVDKQSSPPEVVVGVYSAKKYYTKWTTFVVKRTTIGTTYAMELPDDFAIGSMAFVDNSRTICIEGKHESWELSCQLSGRTVLIKRGWNTFASQNSIMENQKLLIRVSLVDQQIWIIRKI